MRTIMLFSLALLVAGVAAFSVKNILGGKGGGDAQAVASAPQVLVAKYDIPAGSFVRADRHLEWMDWPTDNLHDSYIRPINHTMEDFNGAVSRQDIHAGEPVSASRLIQPGEGGFMSAVLSPNTRAISISVDMTSGNAGFIFPGDRVDLLLTHEVPNDDGSSGYASETFLENVRVLAMDQRLSNRNSEGEQVSASPARTATLEMTKHQVEMIQVATELGKISMSLRSMAQTKLEGKENTIKLGMNTYVHKGKTYTRDSDVSRLLGHNQVHTTLPRKVSVVRGDEAEEVMFDGVR